MKRLPFLRAWGAKAAVVGWLLLGLISIKANPQGDTSAAPRWWKGNLHTHTLWSDGDDYPESIIEWYKDQGYHFLALTDHNVIQAGENWISIDKNKGGRPAFDRYLARFGTNWVEQRLAEDGSMVRLKTLTEIRPLFEEAGCFLLMTGQEITDRHKVLPLHMNAYNILELIPPGHGSNVVDVLQANVDAVLAQRQRTGRLMVPHINHPNFGYGITAEELMQIRGERFFEVYNGHPAVHNEGDEYHVSMDRMWDIVLSFRLTELKLGPMYGLAVDDSHVYHTMASTNSNPGRGWIMVRASELNPETILRAMETGDFYASSGVVLRDLRATDKRLELEIQGEEGVSYITQFIGTRRGFDRSSEAGPRPPGGSFPVTRQYSRQIGEVLAEVPGLKASYALKGDEIYVRAKIFSSKLKANPYRVEETECAWVQPILPSP